MSILSPAAFSGSLKAAKVNCRTNITEFIGDQLELVEFSSHIFLAVFSGVSAPPFSRACQVSAVFISPTRSMIFSEDKTESGCVNSLKKKVSRESFESIKTILGGMEMGPQTQLSMSQLP